MPGVLLQCMVANAFLVFDFGKVGEPGVQLGVVEGVGWGEEEEPAGEAAHANGACWCMSSCL